MHSNGDQHESDEIQRYRDIWILMLVYEQMKSKVKQTPKCKNYKLN